jgi:Beta propeller domain
MQIGTRARVVVVVLVFAGGAAALFGPLAPARERAVAAARGERARQQLHKSRPHLRVFPSCASLVRYGRRYLALTHGVAETPVPPLAGSPLGVGVGPVASPPSTAGAPAATSGAGGGSYSTTNNQEPGVDEPDTVKTNGSTIFAVSQNRLFAVPVAGGAPRLAGSLDLGSSGYGSKLLLRGSHLIVISGGVGIGPLPVPLGGAALVFPSPYYYGGQTTLTEVDVSDPQAMKILRTVTIDGSFVDARENGATARVVISSAPRVLAYPALRGRVAGYVPRWRFHSLLSGRRSSRPVATCRHIARPATFSGLGMVTIFTFNVDSGLSTTQTDALMADAQIVYGSPRSLYLATEKWINPAIPATELPTQTTQIDRFDVSAPDSTKFVASGDVPGYLLNQFSLSEWGGYLRVASTSRPDWWGGAVPTVPSQSYVTVLATSGDRLTQVGQVSGLGAGQKIYSVRFIGDTGYVVTFRQVDPLYTIDLKDPTAPRVAGRLELEGYSSYLHPLEKGLLLGVGQDVGANNEPAGSQLELFDVSDPSTPKLVHKTTLGQGSSSGVQYDHHAFLFWPATNLVVIPLQIYPIGPPVPLGQTPVPLGQTQGFIGAIGFHVDRSGLREAGRISHPATNGYAPPITRSIVIGDRLYTLSDQGILASRLDTLAAESFVAFPSAPAPSGPVGIGIAP